MNTIVITQQNGLNNVPTWVARHKGPSFMAVTQSMSYRKAIQEIRQWDATQLGFASWDNVYAAKKYFPGTTDVERVVMFDAPADVHFVTFRGFAGSGDSRRKTLNGGAVVALRYDGDDRYSVGVSICSVSDLFDAGQGKLTALRRLEERPTTFPSLSSESQTARMAVMYMAALFGMYDIQVLLSQILLPEETFNRESLREELVNHMQTQYLAGGDFCDNTHSQYACVTLNVDGVISITPIVAEQEPPSYFIRKLPWWVKREADVLLNHHIPLLAAPIAETSVLTDNEAVSEELVPVE